MGIEKVPPEILHSILVLLTPQDLAQVSQVDRSMNHFLTSNNKLFRDVLVSIYDKPRNEEGIDFTRLLKDATRLACICASEDVKMKAREVKFVQETSFAFLNAASASGRAPWQKILPDSKISEFMQTIFTVPDSSPATASANDNMGMFMCNSSLFHHMRGDLDPAHDCPSQPEMDERQRSAKLHALYARPIRRYRPAGPTRNDMRVYPYASARVYDIRNYTEQNHWGPYRNDGSFVVDWEKIEALLVTLAENIDRHGLEDLPASVFWRVPFGGSFPYSYVGTESNDGKTKKGLDLKDPYNVTGTYFRIVCFLDYSEFASYNFPSNGRRPVPTLDVEEATRLIIMSLKVTKITDPDPEDSQEHPVVHFKGLSRWLDGRDLSASPAIRGTVRTTKEGEVRWTSISIFNGEERWKSECIQVGGIQSARGVVGSWFDAEHDPHGPVGPTAFWKVMDKVMDDKDKKRDMSGGIGPLVNTYNDNGDDGDEMEDGYNDMEQQSGEGEDDGNDSALEGNTAVIDAGYMAFWNNDAVTSQGGIS